MVRNLVDNAIEHGGGHPVRVKSVVEAPVARIVVEDDGPGIAEEDEDRIFEHFHRGADARAISGAGLGLGIAREVALRHGGHVAIDSRVNPTRFVITLPIMKTSSSGIQAAAVETT